MDTDGQSGESREHALVRRFGRHSTSFQVLAPSFLWWHLDADAGLAYVDTGGAWVVAGPPLCAPERAPDVAAAFVTEARRHRRRTVFFAASKALAQDPRNTSLIVGQEPVYTPSSWAKHKHQSATIRQQLRRARNKHLNVRRLSPTQLRDDPALNRHIEALMLRWSGAHAMPPMGFLVDLNPFDHQSERSFWLADVPGPPGAPRTIVGFAAVIPIMASGAMMLEHLLRDPNAPNGCAESLIDAVFTDAHDTSFVSLGMVPLHKVTHPILRAALWTFEGLYHFGGLARFKAKLGPSVWEEVPLVWPKSQWMLFSLYDVLCAFAPQGLWRFAAGIAGRGSSALLRILAWTLVPWTVALASMEGDVWFPTKALQHFWTAFDVLLAAGLFALSHRWRRSLATGLATLITCDTIATCVEAVVYREPRGLFGDAVRLVACAAPAATAWVLWNARAYRARFRLKGQPQPEGPGKT